MWHVCEWILFYHWIWIFIAPVNIKICDISCILTTLPRYVSALGPFMIKPDWTRCHGTQFPNYPILHVNFRFAIGCHCGVCCRGLTSFTLYIGPIFCKSVPNNLVRKSDIPITVPQVGWSVQHQRDNKGDFKVYDTKISFGVQKIIKEMLVYQY